MEVSVVISLLRISVSVVCLMVRLSQSLLEKRSNIIRDSLQFLVALRFSSLETTGHMPAYKGHGDGVGTAPVAGAGIETRSCGR